MTSNNLTFESTTTDTLNCVTLVNDESSDNTHSESKHGVSADESIALPTRETTLKTNSSPPNANEPSYQETCEQYVQDKIDSPEANQCKQVIMDLQQLKLQTTVNLTKPESESALLKRIQELEQERENTQEKHDEELRSLRTQLADANAQRKNGEVQYSQLLERIKTIRSQLRDKLETDAEELKCLTDRVNKLKEENVGLSEKLKSEVAKAKQHEDKLVDELAKMREASRDWENLAMYEQDQRKALSEQVAELSEGILMKNEEVEASERNKLSMEKLNERIKSEFDVYKEKVAREMSTMKVESERDLKNLKAEWTSMKAENVELRAKLQSCQCELERVRGFEDQVKEKSLQIGKLRHEAVILNEHLIKALKVIKQHADEDKVDRELITNHILHFLSLERGDGKKFQVLQLIAALLSWDDSQRELAGLSRKSAASASTVVSPSVTSVSTSAFLSGLASAASTSPPVDSQTTTCDSPSTIDTTHLN